MQCDSKRWDIFITPAGIHYTYYQLDFKPTDLALCISWPDLLMCKQGRLGLELMILIFINLILEDLQKKLHPYWIPQIASFLFD